MKKQPTTISVAEFYHELTKYSPESLSADIPDPLKKPPIFKDYLSERTVDLKPFLKSWPVQGGAQENMRSTLRSISRLLYHTGGITDIVEGRGGPIYFRAAPSAGALYPIEIYLSTCQVPGLPDGIHNYSVREHALVPIWEGDFRREFREFCFGHPAAALAKMFLIFTCIFKRSAWRYRDRAYRRILLDGGHVLGNAVAYAPEEGLGVVTVAAFYDAAVGDLLFLERDEESVLLVAPLIQRSDLEGATVESMFARPSPRNSPPQQPGEKGLMLLLHESSTIQPNPRLQDRLPDRAMCAMAYGDRGEEGSSIPLGPPAPEAEAAAEAIAPSLGPVIRKRRSARAFGKGPMKLETLAEVLQAAYAPVEAYYAQTSRSLVDCTFIDPTMIATYLVAVQVDGLSPGVYRFHPHERSLAPKRSGDFRTEIWNLCLGQEIGREASAAVIHVADLPACVERYGDRAYRYLHLDAGHLGERINLAAVARGFGVSGIGGFFDAEVNALLEIPEKISILYITLLGQKAGEGGGEP